MNYLNLHLPVLTGEAFLHATREQIGTWLLLCAYCAAHENSGRIKGCKNWAPATWLIVTRCDGPGLESPLWAWREDDLIVLHYPREHEQKARKNRLRAQHAANKRWVKHLSRKTEPETAD